MRVLVVARTRLGTDRVCVGGIAMDTGDSVRLLGSDERNLPASREIHPGEIWELEYAPSQATKPPHVEDVVVSHGRCVEVVDDLEQAILQLATPWRGELDEIFEGCLTTTETGRAYVPPDGRIPSCSTGFWRSNLTIRQSNFSEHGTSYWVPDGASIRSIKYRGVEDPIEVIPSGSLVRFSLARWAEFPPGVGEKRCFLQLSGWYLERHPRRAEPQRG